MAALELRCLGPLQVRHEGAQLTAQRLQKGQALLCYLAVTGRVSSRPTLAGLLWSDVPEENARISLRKALSQLRRHMPDHLLVTREEISLNAGAPYWLDTAEFERGVASWEIERVQAALLLYRGDFLESFALPDAPLFDEWAQVQRARLRELALAALRQLIDHFTTTRAYETAERYARQLLAIESWDEEIHRQLMRLLARGGRRGAALKQFELCQSVLAEELGVTPSLATRRLYEEIRQGELSGESLRVLSPRHNLPAQVTSFVGRERELSLLDNLFKDPTIRLVTILGPGGIGKTSLALAVAEAQLLGPQQRHPFPDGVYFVSLAPLASDDLLLPAIAETLGFRFYDGAQAKTQLLDYLRHKSLLLVLDNFEHLMAGAALMDEIVQAAPGVKLLLTSRQKLRRQAEQLFPLGGLLYPPENADVNDPGFEDYSAIQLFLKSASRVQPRFRLAREQRLPLLRLCRLVEGMPLALVLAASWMELLTPQELVDEIGDDLDFLAAEQADVPARQHSLRAAFNHSWRLLSSREKLIFSQLAVFRGGFTRHAAQIVAGAALRDLQALVNKSLLSVTAGGRYNVHELLRHFGLEQLAADREQEASTRAAHAAYFSAFIGEREDALKGPRSEEAEAEIAADFENVRAAWNWAADNLEPLVYQAQAGLGRFYDSQARYEEGKAAFLYAVERLASGKAVDAKRMAELLAWASHLIQWSGAHEMADELIRRATVYLSEAVEQGEKIEAQRAFVLLVQSRTNQPYRVRVKLLKESLSLYQKLDMPWELAWAHNRLAWLYGTQGRNQSALKQLRQALRLREMLGDRSAIIWTKINIASGMARVGELEVAEARLQEALVACGSRAYEPVTAFGLWRLGEVQILRGRFEEAKKSLAKGRALYALRGDGIGQKSCHNQQLWAALHLGRYDEVIREAHLLLTGEHQSGEPLAYHQATVGILMGSVALARGMLDEARVQLLESVTILDAISRPEERGWAQATLGYVGLLSGELTTARMYLAKALRLRLFFPQLVALPAVALLLVEAGDDKRAIELFALSTREPFVANSRWIADVAGRRISAIARALPAGQADAARRRGEALDRRQTVDEMFRALKS